MYVSSNLLLLYVFETPEFVYDYSVRNEESTVINRFLIFPDLLKITD